MNAESNRSMIMALVAKDWYFNKNTVLFFSFVGLFSVYLLSFKSMAFYIGMILLLSIVILIGALLVTTTVVNERKQQTLAFVMSLPISCMDYTKAKLLINLSVYITLWLVLVSSTMAVILTTNHLPNGLIPYALIILIELLLSFILVLGTALVTESEKWTIVVMTITNISVSLFMFLIASIKDINQHMEAPQAVWNSQAITIISIELISAFIIIATTFYLQSRKKDFIS